MLARKIWIQVAVGAATLVGLFWVVVSVHAGFERNGIALDWSVLTRASQFDRGTYLDNVISGMVLTLKISGMGIVFATLLGTCVGSLRQSSNPIVRGLAAVYVELFRNTPLLIQLFFWNFALVPALSKQALPLFAFLEKLLNVPFGDAVFAGVGALSVYTSAYIAETLRAGIQSLPKGQTEAAASLGLADLQILWHVILPQAFRAVFPPLGSQYLNLIKNSSLLHVLGLPELLYAGTQMQNYEGRGFEAITTVTLSYLVISLSTVFVLRAIERRVFPKSQRI